MIHILKCKCDKLWSNARTEYVTGQYRLLSRDGWGSKNFSLVRRGKFIAMVCHCEDAGLPAIRLGSLDDVPEAERLMKSLLELMS